MSIFTIENQFPIQFLLPFELKILVGFKMELTTITVRVHTINYASYSHSQSKIVLFEF